MQRLRRIAPMTSVRCHVPKSFSSMPTYNFSPGPTSLPRPVLQRLTKELTHHATQCSISPMELSHRSPSFHTIQHNTEQSLRRLLDLPEETFDVLFMHGGGHGQFAAVPLNLASQPTATAHYFVNGAWSQRAAMEASKYCNITTKGIKTLDDTVPENGWWQPSNLLPEDVPCPENTGSAMTPRSAYCYLCSNETVQGLEYFDMPELHTLQVPLVVDMSSDICSKPINFNHVDVAFACAPKNLGIAGLTVVIVRKTLLEKRQAQAITPGILDYRLNVANHNVWNTPPTFNVYVAGLMCTWMEEMGGVAAMERRAIERSNAVYAEIDGSDGFWGTRHSEEMYKKDPSFRRSRMNVPFCIARDDDNNTMATKLLEEASKRNIAGLYTVTPFDDAADGGGSGGGANKMYFRASLYNHVEMEAVEVLVDFMETFRRKHCE